MKDKKELKQIRKEREKHNQKDNNHPQRRRIEVIEYDDGNYSLIGFAWNLQLKKDEIKDAFESWLDGSLENGIDLGVRFNKKQ
ncbi:hypothetical protein LCGC14_1900640 [marine sediment metagenome]|uniref:Uncharacterized protein n=1 Tax=marine sediment metagenome TaxID=412755 RepID=A0A0F9FWZ5_9ZZZZ